MPSKGLINSIKDFIKTNWEKLLGAIGAIGSVVLYLADKLKNLPSAYWLILMFSFWLFILVWAALTIKRGSSHTSVCAVGSVAFVLGVVVVGYYATASSVYLFAEVPAAAGQIFKRDPSAISLKASGLTDEIVNENYHLTFSEQADYVETEFNVNPSQQQLVRDFLTTYEDAPQYKGKVEKSNTKIGIKNVVPGFSIDIVLIVELKQEMQNPEINVDIEKRYDQRNWWWRFKRWVFERY